MISHTRTYMPEWHSTDRHLEALVLETVHHGERPMRKRKLWFGGVPVKISMSARRGG